MGQAERAAKEILQTERRARALDLRRQGMSYSNIGLDLGITEASAHQLVKRALATMVREPAADVVVLENARLDDLLVKAHERLRMTHELATNDKTPILVVEKALLAAERAAASVLAVVATRAKIDGRDRVAVDMSGSLTHNDGPDTSKLTQVELVAHFTLMAKAARTDVERERYEAAAKALTLTTEAKGE